MSNDWFDLGGHVSTLTYNILGSYSESTVMTYPGLGELLFLLFHDSKNEIFKGILSRASGENVVEE